MQRQLAQDARHEDIDATGAEKKGLREVESAAAPSAMAAAPGAALAVGDSTGSTGGSGSCAAGDKSNKGTTRRTCSEADTPAREKSKGRGCGARRPAQARAAVRRERGLPGSARPWQGGKGDPPSHARGLPPRTPGAVHNSSKGRCAHACYPDVKMYMPIRFRSYACVARKLVPNVRTQCTFHAYGCFAHT